MPRCLETYPCVIFDWDGTLSDSTACIVQGVQAVAVHMGLDVPEAALVRQGIGLTTEQQVVRCFPGMDVDVQTFRLLLDQHNATLRASCAATLYPGALELIAHLEEQGVLLAVATAMGRKQLHTTLENTDLLRRFALTRTAEETAPKPNPAMLEDILTVLGLKPEQAVMVGDTTYDVQMGQAAGMDTVAVTRGAHSREALEAVKPTWMVGSVQDLLPGCPKP